MKYVIALLALIALFWPSHTVLEHTYQSSLWTASTWRKNSENVPIEDVVFSFGSSPVQSKIHKWHRVRLGLIVKPITIDYQSQQQVLQIRLEPYYFLVFNLPIALGMVGIGIIIGRLLGKSK